MKKSKIAPIAIFAYNRSSHLVRTINSLSKCYGFGESPITVYIDGPKNEKDKVKISKVKNVVYELLGNYAEIKCRPFNIGLAKSITSGVQEQLDSYNHVIVLEDDLILSQNFLIFMSNALHYYADDQSVFQISGFSYDVPALSSSNTSFLMPFTTTWGWGTWSRAWKSYDSMATGWQALRDDNALRKKFNLDGVYDYASMLEDQMKNNIDSWGIRWYWSVFKKNGVVLFPPKSMVRNIGMDGTGVHGRGILTNFSSQIETNDFEIPNLPSKKNINKKYFSYVKKAIWKQNGGYSQRILKSFFNTAKHINKFLNKGK
jgi:hypothetical protein